MQERIDESVAVAQELIPQLQIAIGEDIALNTADAVLSPVENRAEWIRQRYNFIPDVPLEESGSWMLGATDLAAVLGINQWASPFTVYALYRDLVTRQEATDQMNRGLIMEPYIASVFHEVYKFPIRKVETVRHPVHKFLGASGDYQVLPDDAWWNMLGELHEKDYSCFYGKWVNLDCKSHDWFVKISENYGEKWTDAIADHEISQGVWQAKCYDVPCTIFFVAWGISFRDMVPYVVMANEKLASRIEAKGVKFVHEHLLPGIPPPVGGSEADASCVKRMMPPAVDKKAIELTDKRRQLCEELYNARKASAAAEFEQTRLENILKLEYQEATELATQYGPCTYRANKNGVRSLRFLGAKGKLIQSNALQI